MTLKWSPANAKTKNLTLVPNLQKYLQGKRKVYSMDLLSGHTCPYAELCLSKVVTDVNGRNHIQDGPKTEFRCFSASQEVIYPDVFRSRKHNWDLLRQANAESQNREETTNIFQRLLTESMPHNLGIARIHVAGDFFNPSYFDAWLRLSQAHNDRLFYAYTKSLPFWQRRLGELPDNFVLTASFGGTRDDLIHSLNLRHAKVVFSELEAGHLPIDHDDSHAADPLNRDNSFALLLHGVQPKGTNASKALSALKGKGSYGRK